jgi:hypothetical protein
LAVGVAPKEPVGDGVGPLLIVVKWVYTSANQIFVKLGLLRVEGLAFELVDWGCAIPERMTLQFMPRDAFDRVFLQKPSD